MLPDIFRGTNYLKDIMNRDRDWDWKVESIFNNFFTEFDTIFGDTKYLNDDGDVVYEIEVPGFNKDNLSVEIVDGILTVQGEREDYSNVHAGKKSIHKRMSVGEAENVNAEIKDGILYITIERPKEEKVKSKKIEIK